MSGLIIKRSEDGKFRVLSLSYGKDSLACLGAIEQLGWTLDRIITADVWATDTIPADLPPMVEFKKYADAEILKRYGIAVEHYRATNTFETVFYREYQRGKHKGIRYGFPTMIGNWCNSQLKVAALKKAQSSSVGCVAYIGIAADEPSRFHILNGMHISPLVEIGWTEEDCMAWCKDHGLLSPIYSTTARGGCWFCHNQGIKQLRTLRENYPDLWALLLKWDVDSPFSFHPDGKTVHDFDKRFSLEDEGFITEYEPWRWSMLDAELNYRWF